MKKRSNPSPQHKTKVALAASRDELAVTELSKSQNVLPTKIYE